MNFKISPEIIYKEISKSVIGQHHAKVAVSNAVFMHYVKFFQRRDEPEVKLKPTNLLILGPSGNGKTHLIQSASKAVQDITGYPILPMLEIDTTTLTSRGWEGEDMGDYLANHYKSIKNTPQKELVFKSTIVFLDEFDKLANPAKGKSGTDHNKNTQYSLLKVLEGSPVFHKETRRTYDTGGMLFILGGNFPKIRHMRDQRDKESIGLYDVNNSTKKDLNVFSELEKAGVVTQIAGRIGNVTEILRLNKKELKKILIEHTIPSRKSTFDYLGYEVNVSRRDITKIVNEAHDKNMGARGLDSALDRQLEKIIFDMEFEQ